MISHQYILKSTTFFAVQQKAATFLFCQYYFVHPVFYQDSDAIRNGLLLTNKRPKTSWPSCMSAQTTNGKVKVLGHHKKGIVVLGKLRLSAAYRQKSAEDIVCSTTIDLLPLPPSQPCTLHTHFSNSLFCLQQKRRGLTVLPFSKRATKKGEKGESPRS